MYVRKSKVRDRTAILKIARKFANEINFADKQQMLEEHIGTDKVIVACAETDRPIGFVYAYLRGKGHSLYNSGRNHLYVSAICVDEDHHKQGVATSLMKELVTSNSHRRILGKAATDSTAGVKTYMKSGFTAIASQITFERPADAKILESSLKTAAYHLRPFTVTADEEEKFVPPSVPNGSDNDLPEKPNDNKDEPDVSAEDKELKKGIEEEKEHADTYQKIKDFYEEHGEFPKDEDVYEWIAKDHLADMDNYYTELEKMEEKAKPQEEGDGGLTDVFPEGKDEGKTKFLTEKDLEDSAKESENSTQSRISKKISDLECSPSQQAIPIGICPPGCKWDGTYDKCVKKGAQISLCSKEGVLLMGGKVSDVRQGKDSSIEFKCGFEGGDWVSSKDYPYLLSEGKVLTCQAVRTASAKTAGIESRVKYVMKSLGFPKHSDEWEWEDGVIVLKGDTVSVADVKKALQEEGVDVSVKKAAKIADVTQPSLGEEADAPLNTAPTKSLDIPRIDGTEDVVQEKVIPKNVVDVEQMQESVTDFQQVSGDESHEVTREKYDGNVDERKPDSAAERIEQEGGGKSAEDAPQETPQTVPEEEGPEEVAEPIDVPRNTGEQKVIEGEEVLQEEAETETAEEPGSPGSTEEDIEKAKQRLRDRKKKMPAAPAGQKPMHQPQPNPEEGHTHHGKKKLAQFPREKVVHTWEALLAEFAATPNLAAYTDNKIQYIVQDGERVLGYWDISKNEGYVLTNVFMVPENAVVMEDVGVGAVEAPEPAVASKRKKSQTKSRYARKIAGTFRKEGEFDFLADNKDVTVNLSGTKAFSNTRKKRASIEEQSQALYADFIESAEGISAYADAKAKYEYPEETDKMTVDIVATFKQWASKRVTSSLDDIVAATEIKILEGLI